MSKMNTHWGACFVIAIGKATALWAIAGVSVSGSCVHAQIVPDGTLPNNSIVNINGNIFDITGGTRAGSNLFHSFQQFSVPNGSTASFNNALDIQNIISRVTGSSVSNIDGLIKVLQGNANLFLLNPNGIVFGSNARLDIRGSFVASTANSIKFADGFEFSAKNAQSTPLLTVSVPLGLQFGANPQRIQVIGDGQGVRVTSVLEDTQNALRVQPNQTLALVGGEISLEGGTLKTAGGRIELGSVSGEGLVSLTPINKGFALGYAAGQNFGNIQLSQKAVVDTSGTGGGNVQVIGRSVTLEGGSQIETSTLGSQPGGTLVLNASESVKVSGSSSGLFTAPYPRATGNAGDLTINTGTLQVQNGGMVDASTYGAGKGGNLTVNATDSVEVVGNKETGAFSSLGANVSSRNATGDAGDLTIQTRRLSIRDRGIVSVDSYGTGNAGNLLVQATDLVEVVGTGESGTTSYLSADVVRGANKGGDLTIQTGGRLSIRDGGEVSASTFGLGNTGRLLIQARDLVEVIGSSAENGARSRIATNVYSNARGNAGNLTIETGRMVVKDAQVGATTFGSGNAANLTVRASDSIELSGVIFGEVDDYPAGLFAQVNSEGSGRGGKLNIETGRLSISNGAKVQIATFGTGDTGDLFIRASEIDIFETTQPRYSYYPTGIYAGVRRTRSATELPKGNGGSITIETNRLRVRDGGVVTTGTQGQGNAGSLRIRATESVEVFGTAPGAEFRDPEEPRNSEISAATTLRSTGNGGLLSLETGKLIVSDRGTVTVRSEGSNRAGNIEINARSINLDNQGSLTATSNAGEGGNIFLDVQDLLLMRRNSLISNTSGTQQQGGDGGNLTINAPNGFIVSVPNENSDIFTNAFNGRGGNITISALKVYNFVVRTQPELVRLLATNDPNQLDPQKVSTNDIASSSQSSFQLTTDNALDFGLELPTLVVDTSGLIDTSCAAFSNGKSSQFTVTGRGGLPPNPYEPLSTDVVWSDTRTSAIAQRAVALPIASQQPAIKTRAAKPPSKAEVIEIIPATGWVFNGKGQVTLISHASNANGLRSTSTSCPK